MKGYGPKRCIGSCDPFFCRKTQAVVDVTCKDCPHNDSAQGEAAGLHHRFCHCVFDKRKDTGRMKGTSRRSPETASTQNNPPSPDNSDVYLSQKKNMTVFATTVGGYPDHGNEAAKLKDILERGRA